MPELHDDEFKLRLEALERACRRWKTVGLSALVASGVTLLITGSGIAQLQSTVPPRQASTATAAESPIDESGIPINYVNFARITDNSEDLFLVLGINTRSQSNPNEAIKVTGKFVMNYYNAKRLQQGLQIAVDRYEKQFGPIEPDPNKRALPGVGKVPVRQP